MGMPATIDPRYWTPDDILALPADGKRYECIDGELLVNPSPSFPHQDVVLSFAVRLREYCGTSGSIGRVCVASADVQLDGRSLVQPDIFVAAPTPDGRPVRDWKDITALRLTIEVLSPSTARYDRGLKRRHYQRARVEEYWIVDLEARLVERWRPDDERPEILAASLAWLPDGANEALVIDLVALFTDALGE